VPCCDEDTGAAFQVKHADTICEYKLKEDPDFMCCLCEHLLLRKNVTMFKFHNEKFNTHLFFGMT